MHKTVHSAKKILLDSVYSQKTLGTAFTVKRIHWAVYTAKKTLQVKALNQYKLPNTVLTRSSSLPPHIY